jgi:hypothetical protein
VSHRSEPPQQTIYRNFNVCPHCSAHGEQNMLRRIREGMPMISRSDGKSFHLLLADRPVPYPAERQSGPSKLVSICFWYSHVAAGQQMSTSVVVLPELRHRRGAFYRSIEVVADLLTGRLRHFSRLSEIYDFQNVELRGLHPHEVLCVDEIAPTSPHGSTLGYL